MRKRRRRRKRRRLVLGSKSIGIRVWKNADFFFYFMCTGILFAYHIHAVPSEARKNIRSRVTDGCEPLCW